MNVMPRKGVIARLFGVVFMALGMLGCMLSWRGGLVDGDLYFIQFLGGALLFALGSIRGRYVSVDPQGRLSREFHGLAKPTAEIAETARDLMAPPSIVKKR